MTNKEAIKYLQQLYPNGGHCWLDEQRIEAIGMAVKALKEEPVSEDLDFVIGWYCSNPDNFATWIGGKENDDIPLIIKAIKFGANWQKEQIMAKAIDAHCFGFQGAALFSFRLPADNYLVGSEVKVIVIKED